METLEENQIYSKMYLQNSSSTPLQRSFDQRERIVKKRKKKPDKLSNGINKDKSSTNNISFSITKSNKMKMSPSYSHKLFIHTSFRKRSLEAFLFILLYFALIGVVLGSTSDFKFSNALEKKNSLRFHSSSSLFSSNFVDSPSTSSYYSSPAKLSVSGSEIEKNSHLEEIASSLTFTRSEYQASIPENSLGRVYVIPTAESERMGLSFANETIAKKLNVKFKIKGGDPDDMFKAESELVGDFVFLMIRIKTSNKVHLNRERKSHYSLEIVSRMKEKGPGKKRRLRSPLAKTVVKVRVTDTNDLDPFFQSSTYTFNVPEDTPLHTSIGKVTAEDADEGINGEIYYSIIRHASPSQNSRNSNHPTSTSEENIFAVDPVSGVLSLTRPLNFRDKSQHQLTIVAQDRGPKSTFTTRHADTAKITIHVKQVNLHDPEMRVQHLPEVIENSNTDIYAIIKVTDPDPGRHGEVDSLEIIEGDPEAHFRVRPSFSSSNSSKNEFNIEVLQLLDREISPYGYNLTLKAVDRGVPPRTSYKDVHVKLGDFNDHSPIFDKEIYEVTVNESVPINTSLARLKVTDRDSGRNAKIQLRISAGNKYEHFRIHPKSGMLYVAKKLDAERRTSYTLTVSALDQANTGMRKQSSARVRIFVQDVNDNDPKFQFTMHEVTFDENQQKGSEVYTVQANDLDSGENGYISYSIANVNEVPFEIDNFSGVIKSTRLIDYESDRRVYKLKIRASDWGTPYRRQSEMRLTIKIKDINDNRPQFERVECRGNIPRSIPQHSNILTLSALDFDSQNAISYRVVSGNSDSCFSLDTHSGVLSLVCDLRTLPTRQREINVTATDGQHFADVMPIIIRIIDEDSSTNGYKSFGNDNNLYQSNSNRNTNYVISDYSNLFKCKETDVAKRFTETLRIAERNNLPGNHLKDMSSGGYFDDGGSELNDHYLFPSRYGSNIHRPEFNQFSFPNEIEVNETVSLGTTLVTVKAHDRDLGFNGYLLYVISDGDEESNFKLDTETGELRVDNYLDRETKTDYYLNITVYDQGLPQKSSSHQLHVTVKDVNDNPPVFVKSSFSFYFPENTPINTPVVTLTANDLDEGDNGKVKYSLVTDTEDFELDEQSGLLLVSKSLDREERDSYELTIRATDGNIENPLSSYAIVRVIVVDVNDVAPRFSSSKYVVKAREDLPLGTVVGTVEASDPDLYQGGKIKYSFKTSGMGRNKFEIDEISGTIRIRSPLDYEEAQSYNLTIKATDEGSPSLSTLSSFIVEVVDVNENLHPPRFESFFLRTAVPENMPSSSHVATVTAKDLDTHLKPNDDDAKISYSIRGGDGLGTFFIDSEDGNIKTLAPLDRESKQHYWLAVYAQDHGATPLFSRLDVYIEVLNMNDNVPLTSKPVYYPKIAENSKPFTPIITLEAHDADLLEDNEVQEFSYDIISGNPQSLFFINSHAGIISTTNRILDREVQNEHTLEVLVSDKGNPPLNSTTRVIVAVTDENDNRPKFLERFYKLSVPETVIKEEQFLQNDQENLDGIDINNENGTDVITDDEIHQGWDNDYENTTWESFEKKDLIGVPLFRVPVSDLDTGFYGRIRYSIKLATESQTKFQIDPFKGIVYARKSLLAGEHYEMLIKAVDSIAYKRQEGDSENDPLSSLARVSLNIGSLALTEENKHPPRLEEYVLRSDVLETDPVGHLVAHIVADDKDRNNIWFSIADGDANNDFYISPDKGSIILAQQLDREKKKSYNLTIIVTDGKYKTNAQALINVIDVNENRPQFFSKSSNGPITNYEVDIQETASVGSEVIRFNVSDKDTNVKLSYSIHISQDPKSISKFKIHPLTGVITVKEILDRERTKQHVLIVSVKDDGTPTRTNYARVCINVIDGNDNKPTFMTDLIQTKLHETAQIDEEVIQVLAIDNDHGENGRITYSILSGNVGNSFAIDKMLGIIRVARNLDISVESEYMLMVRATDNGRTPLSDIVPVHIMLTMSDDAAPKFVLPHYATEVHENIHKGSSVITVTARSQSSLWYEIISGNEDGAFVVNPSTGIVMTQNYLDFETKRFYNLTISASNLIGIKTQCTVNIHVIDINDNAPVFDKNFFHGHISELSTPGSLILAGETTPLVIKASDKDIGMNSLLYYDILDVKTSRYFAIDNSTGAIRLTKKVDHEECSSFEFDVRVFDHGTPRLSSDKTARVKIEIDDENDSPPIFEKEDYSETLLLPAFEGMSVLSIKAVDPDVDINTTLTYSLIGNSKVSNFKIDSTKGTIFVSNAVEVTNGPKVHTLEVSVSDGKFSSKTKVRIRVRNSENSGLAFEKSQYNASVFENSTKSNVIAVMHVLGTTLNENLRFSLITLSDYFVIGETSGAIRTTGKAFDREEKDHYELVVQVKSVDKSRKIPRMAHVIVYVKVIDLNDNPPIFINKPYYAVVSRGSPKDAVVLRVTAIDKDVGPNGEIYYQLANGKGDLFRVGRKSGLITLRSTLEGYQKDYKLKIAAYDGGTPPFSADVLVYVKVVDQSVPSFTEQLYRASIKENVDTFSPILETRAESPVITSTANGTGIGAVRKDQENGNGRLFYTIESGNSNQQFSIDYSSGVISVTDVLDYETKQHHQLTVRATDAIGGGYAETIVLLDIEDVNDCPPRFSNQSYILDISEATSIGSNLFVLHATDADSIGLNSDITYSLHQDHINLTNYFDINAESGIVTLKRKLDYEERKQFQFEVMAIDKGAPASLSSTSVVTINVIDSNDNPPAFEDAEYNIKISDKAYRGQFVGRVRAIDPDEIDNGQLNYAIIGGNEHQSFSIDEESGILTLVNLHNFNKITSYVLNVSASDGIFSCYARVAMNLISSNSHSPTFSDRIIKVKFAENQPEGVLVGRLEATDEDLKERITYAIQSEKFNQFFGLDELTGEIWSKIMFDREHQETYEIPVSATDIGGRNGFCTFKVIIDDVNDNPPQFNLDEYKANIKNSLSIGSTVVQVKATDKDKGKNADLVYSIYEKKSSGINNIFKINSKTGKIVLKKNVKNLKNQIYQFFVRAQDKGFPSLHSEVPVEVYIMSPLDRPPIFERKDTLFYVDENSPVGKIVVTLKATTSMPHEQDENPDGLSYRLVSSAYITEKEEDALFQIDQTGRVIVSGHLNREKRSIHHLTFIAETDTSPTLNAYYNLIVQVIDQNDNPPVFMNNPYEVSLSEAVPPHTSVVQVQATDEDFGHNGEVSYSFHPESSQKLASIFSIDPHQGWITTQGVLDYEMETSYELKVIAVDNGSPQKSATSTINVNLMDQNDNPPVFSQRHYTAAVNEGALPGNVIFLMGISDRDKQATSDIDFFITQGDPQGKFQIKKNGEVYVARQLDREQVSSYKLVVKATDGTFITYCKISIEILDDNDSPPVCDKQNYRRTFLEDISPGTELLTVLASDADEGSNAKQMFYLTGEASGNFSIDENTGLVKTALILDRETTETYHFTAHVRDAAMPEWECLSSIEIHVLDSNDNAPIWSQKSFTASLAEDTPVGTIATKIHATDKDLGDNRKIKYSLMDSANNHFKIDASSGIVTLAKPLDRETRGAYNLTVRAMDSGRPRKSSITHLLVVVLDVNDNPPEFGSKYYFSYVNESLSIESEILQLQATSKDSGINAEITYSIIGGNEHRKFSINDKTGMITLLDGLDYEHATGYFLTIEAQDGGDPPLQTRCFCNITVHDENDNAPTFSQPSYSSLINEAAQIGESVAIVTATDMDSGENGKVRYRITHGDRDSQFRIDEDTGTIALGNRLDREMVSSYVLEVEAEDGGSPSLTSSVLIHVDVSDANDNPPLFSESNYTVYVQEDRPFGHILLRLSVTDADESPPNGPPFTFDIRDGNEENAFRFVQDDATLRTAMKFNHKIKDLYKLQLRVFDNGSPPLYSDTFVTVNVIEESKYPPVVQKIDININSYQDEFPGAIIGSIQAEDQDPYDQLSYELVPLAKPSFGISSSESIGNLFEIDQTKGTIIALQGLDVGTYNLNVSVSDGKFTTFSESKVKVNLINDAILEQAVIIRFAAISPEDFVSRYQTVFIKYVKMLLSLQRSKDIFVLGIQPSSSSLRVPRSISKEKTYTKYKSKKDELIMEVKSSAPPPDLEVLFVVQKSKHNYYSRDKVRKALKEKIESLESQMGLNIIEIQEDECTPGMCDNNNGHCEDTVIMEDSSIVATSSSSFSFVSPAYHHDSLCVCKQGFAGERCQMMLNECAKEPCPTYKECIPDSTLKGYSCHCPEGMSGQLCNVNITNCNNGNDQMKCKIVNPLSFSGQSYVSFTVKGSIEKYLNLSLSVRTLHPTGTLMYAAGPIDYSILELYKTKLRYRFNFGSGEGIVVLSEPSLNDGNWHSIVLQRFGNSARLTVDDQHKAHGSAPGINDALNLEGGTGNNVYFGAEIETEDTDDLNKGFIGCLDSIKLDNIALPLHAKAKSRIANLGRLNNVDFSCGQLRSPGRCGTYPCLNSGTCIEHPSSYSCECSSRFEGVHCEYDTNPCASNPCLNGGTCMNTGNGEFKCKCPHHLSGKRCDYGVYCNPNPCQNGAKCEEGSDRAICKCRGYSGTFCTNDIDECKNSNPCANGGICINLNGDFRCECQEDWTGLYCTSKPGLVESSRYVLKLKELIGLIVSLFGIVLFVSICILCRHCTQSEKRKTHTSYNTQMDTSGHESFLNLNGAPTPQMGDPRESRMASNYELTSLDQRPLIPNYSRPMSFTPIQNETGYTDTVRSYGSAADELESLPPVRVVNPINYHQHQQQNNQLPPEYAPNFHQQNFQKPTATVAPSVCASRFVSNQAEGHLDQKILDYYNNRHKAQHNQPSQQPNLSNVHARGVHHRPPNQINPSGGNTDSPGLKSVTSLSSLQTSCTQEDNQKYFWDSFDLNGDGSEQANSENNQGASNIDSHLGAVGGAPQLAGSQIVNGANPRSPESKENKANQNTIQRILKTNEPIDPTRDIETLPEDFGHELNDQQGNNNMNTKDKDSMSHDSDDEPQFGSVYPTNVSNAKAPSTSFEQLLASNDDINFADEEEDDDDMAENGERPNSYDYHLHLNNYLPQHNISEASETDENTPMLARHPPPMPLLNKDIRSPNANSSSRIAGLPSFRPSSKPSQNGGNGIGTFKLELNGTNGDVDLNQSISALPELENESVMTNSHYQFGNLPISNIASLKSAIPPPSSMSSEGNSVGNGGLRPRQLNTTNGEDLFTGSKSKDMDNLCELEDSDCETPTASDAKTVSSSTPKVTRV